MICQAALCMHVHTPAPIHTAMLAPRHGVSRPRKVWLHRWTRLNQSTKINQQNCRTLALPLTVEASAAQHAVPTACTIVRRSLQVLQALLRLWLLQQQTTFSTTKPTAPESQHTYATAVQQLISDLGPLWVKLGQTLAVRPDVVGSRLAAALAGLQESAPPFPTPTAAAILEQELNATPTELFAWWSERPVASASLGQVYQAALRADGRLVAVKVQRPDMSSQIALDLSILTQLLRLLRCAARIQQDITLWATTLGQGLAQELDYEQEARNLTEFADVHRYLGFVGTPQVIWSHTSTRVLTTTWVQGVTPGQILRQLSHARSTDSNAHTAAGSQLPGITIDTAAAAEGPPDAQQTPGLNQQLWRQQQQLLHLVNMGIAATLHQLVVSGVLHADPHPGNLLLSDGKLVFLDFGLLVRVPPDASLAMMAALLHWSQANWLSLAADMRHMGLLKPSTDLQELAADLQLRFEQLYAHSSTPAAAAADFSSSSCTQQSQSALLQQAGAIGFGEFAGVVAVLALKYRFELPPYYTLVIRSLTTLEGFALMVDPAGRQSIARTAVKVIARQLLFDKRPAAQALLQEVLVLQDASAQPPAGHLNLQLLEELLQLAAPAGTLSGPTAAPQSLPGPREMLPLDPVQWCRHCRHLGLPPVVVAGQLSSPQAAGIRALLAQQLVDRWLQQSSRQQRQSQANAAANRRDSGEGRRLPASVGEQHYLVCVSQSHQDSKAHYGWLGLMVHAGLKGVKLVVQLCGLMLMIVTSRVLEFMLRCFQQVAAVIM